MLIFFLSLPEKVCIESKHPTNLIRTSTIGFLKTLSICAGIHAEHAQPEAVASLCGLMLSIVDAGCNYGPSKQHNLNFPLAQDFRYFAILQLLNLLGVAFFVFCKIKYFHTN